MDQYIGKMLDNRYEILERIGTGGMAVVYKTRDHRLNRLVAVKILKPELAQDEDFRRRFNAESQAVAQLSHPNIVSVYDVSRGGDMEYIIMELIDGITLKQYMEKRGQLNWRESLHFITQILRGLSHAHSRGIVHRDIKPQNVMVLRDGSVKVADFGIACLENSAQTLTQEALGSVHYISPEQARGERTDARSDIYSAGVVMYEMLTGRLPFEGDSAVSVAIQHLSSVPLPPRELNPEIPPQLELICMKAMTPDLDRRYSSADAMIADLEDFRKDPNISLDFTMLDLRPEEPVEPTQPIRSYDRTLYPAAKNREREPERSRERRRDYEDDYEPPQRGGAGVKVLVGVAIILALALAAVLVKMVTESIGQEAEVPQSYRVPSVLGCTPEQAAAKEEVNGIFTIKVNEEGKPSDAPVGTIVQQNPPEGNYRKGDNLVIEVWLSAGEETGEMLDVTNKTVAQANVMLKDLKEKYSLEVIADEAEMEFNDEVTEGFIIRSVPAVHEELKNGDVIRLIVSKGPEKKNVTVPSFLTQKIGDVLPALTESWHLTCLESDIEYVESEEEPNTIIWQSLDPNSTVTEWDTIKFKVSGGVTTREVSWDIDLPQDDRTTVQVDVYVGDEVNPQYSERIRCADLYAHVTLTGSGTKTVKVEFDGVLDQSMTHEIQFTG